MLSCLFLHHLLDLSLRSLSPYTAPQFDLLSFTLGGGGRHTNLNSFICSRYSKANKGSWLAVVFLYPHYHMNHEPSKK